MKVFIIGIDGGTWSILKPAMEAGYMPYLKSLVDRGASGVLESTMPAITPAAWSSFLTGSNPGQNGVYNFYSWDKLQKRGQFVNSRFLSETIWDITSIANKRIGVVNVPMTYPPREINGYMVTGILTPSIDSEFTYPPELKSELLSTLPEYHIFNLRNIKSQDWRNKGGVEFFVNYMANIVGCRARAAELIIKKEPLDLFMVHFQASDVLQHVMWGYIDEQSSWYDTVKRNYVFEHFYKVLDEQMMHVRSTFEKTSGRDYISLFVSDHGFSLHNKRFNLGNWLFSEGFWAINPRSEYPPLIKRITRKLHLGKILSYLVSSKVVSKMEKSLHLDTEAILWDRSRVFSIGQGGEGFIYLLEEYSEMRDKTAREIIEKLKSIKDPETGQEFVANVYRREQIYNGKKVDLLPDMIIEPTAGYSFTGGYLAGEHDLFHNVCPEKDFHMGKHHKDGILIAAGVNIEAKSGVRAKLLDIAPTVLYCLGLPAGSEMEGRVLEELFTTKFKSDNPIPQKYNGSMFYGKERRQGYSDSEEDEIRKRLEDLGYM